MILQNCSHLSTNSSIFPIPAYTTMLLSDIYAIIIPTKFTQRPDKSSRRQRRFCNGFFASRMAAGRCTERRKACRTMQKLPAIWDVFPHPYGLKDAEQYINSCLCASRESSICLAIEIDGGAAGSIGVFRMDDILSKERRTGILVGRGNTGAAASRAQL